MYCCQHSGFRPCRRRRSIPLRLSGCRITHFAAAYFLRRRCYDRFRSDDCQSFTRHIGCSSSSRYFRCPHYGKTNGIFTCRSMFHRYYRRCRRSYGNLYHSPACTASSAADFRCRILVYGINAAYSAASNAAFNY